MAIRTAEEAELSDTAPDPVRLKKSDTSDLEEPLSPLEEEADSALDALTYVFAPKKDPLEIHGWDAISTLDNINPIQCTLWTTVQGAKVLAYKAYRGRISEPEEVAQLRDGIKRMLRLTDNLSARNFYGFKFRLLTRRDSHVRSFSHRNRPTFVIICTFNSFHDLHTKTNIDKKTRTD